MSARVRGKANNNPTKLLAYDTFLQSAGSLAGKTLPLGGSWAGSGDTDDFTVDFASHVAKRTAVSDAALESGRYAIAGTEEPTSSKATVTVDANATLGGDFRRGVILRYTDTNNWLMAVVELFTATETRLAVYKRVTGTVSKIGQSSGLGSLKQQHATTISLSAAANGTWQAWVYAAGATSEPAPLISGQDSALATGGTLAKGKGGFYDAQTSSSACTRDYDNFALLAAEPADVILYAGKVAEIRSEGYFRQDSTGTYYGEFPPRGADLYLEPEGDSGAINRLVIVSRRNDVETEADSNVTDKISVEVRVRERFLVPR